MEICDYYSHRDAKIIISEAKLYDELFACLTIKDLHFTRGNPALIKRVVNSRMSNG
jgi:hypothetical protein